MSDEASATARRVEERRRTRLHRAKAVSMEERPVVAALGALASDDSAPRPALASHERRASRLLDMIAGTLVYGRRRARLRFGLDVLAITLAGVLTLSDSDFGATNFSHRWVVIVFAAIVLAAMHWRQAPDDRISGSALDTLANVAGVVSLATMVTIALDGALDSRHALALGVRLWAATVVLLGGSRVVLLMGRAQAVRRPGFTIPTLIVGAGVIGSHLAHRLTERARYGLEPVGYLDADPLPRSAVSDDADGPPVLGTPDDLELAVEQTSAQHVILAFSGEPDHTLVGLARRCHARGVGVSLVPRLYETINERSTLDHVGGLPLLTLRPINPKGWQFAVKHALDRTVACGVLTLMAPIMILIAMCVRITSPGPILFRQRRVGRDGQEFDVLKFRTMYEPGAEAGIVEFLLPGGIAPGGIEGADRRTPIGRVLRDLSLDELPQLLNVLRGDMSLVGPRPERPEYVERFVRDVARYGDRHRVRSGITGWAQVHGLRGQTSIADRVEWDNYYIQNWSLRLDFRILALTVAEVLRFREGS